MTNIVEYYSENGDITFLMEEIWDGEDPVESKVVGFYYGEPNEEDTKYFAHRGVIAKYDYQKGAKPRTDVFYSKPLPIDDKRDRITKMVEKVNKVIADARKFGSREVSFPFNNEDAYFKDVKKMFEDEGYNIFVNIYARCGGTHYTISW